jgi:uncharacterized protein YdhG (YjbR/CyaY superfamily)
MRNNKPVAKNTDEYIAGFPAQVQEMLNKLRTIIKKTAPKAEEIISYQMPAYKYHGMLIYFAAYKGHIGLYPGASTVAAFANVLTKYNTSKGTIQFELNKPLPVALIKQIVKYRIYENEEKMKTKAKK